MQPPEVAQVGTETVALENTVTKMIDVANTFLCEQEDLNMQLSGTTCVAVLLTRDRITCFNVGDSRAVLGSVGPEGQLETTALSWDQKPSDSRESKRIQEDWGEDLIYSWTNSHGQPCGPKRIWIGEDKCCGLGMTRSLGDALGKKYGVIATPTLHHVEVNEMQRVLIIGSDGLWEVMSNDEAVALAMQQGSPDLAA